ncbi:MAG: sulfite exporter TauE/SafE family protein [Thermotoga sp.]|nr:MAG: sulfite exporter TauE/SafE family protein [Thermotoga sp.]
MEPMFMNPLYFTPPIFFVVALVLSMLGMGGSQLYIPILFWLGMDFKTQAIPLGMLLNVVNSASAAYTYGRAGLVEWKTAITFGIFMIISAPIGTWTNLSLPTKPVIAIFAIFSSIAAILMLSGWRPRRGCSSSKSKVTLGAVGGSVLGFFAGLIGRGGGSFVVPLLYMAGLEAKSAAATSAVVVTFSGISSFISHILTAAKPNWTLWILCVIAVFLGSQTGSRLMVRKLKPRSVKLIFGIVLLGVSALLLIKDVILEGG